MLRSTATRASSCANAMVPGDKSRAATTSCAVCFFMFTSMVCFEVKLVASIAFRLCTGLMQGIIAYVFAPISRKRQSLSVAGFNNGDRQNTLIIKAGNIIEWRVMCREETAPHKRN